MTIVDYSIRVAGKDAKLNLHDSQLAIAITLSSGQSVTVSMCMAEQDMQLRSNTIGES